VNDRISVLVTRGTTVESIHRVDAVAVTRAGEQVASSGDPDLVTFMRSSAKPLQALPLARACEDVGGEELAIASASHLADPDQLRAVERLLSRAGAREDDLECGPAGEPPAKLKHNCSGKHAGMLALCRAHDWPFAGYRLAGHPVQERMLDELGAAAELPRDGIPTGVDGCGVVTFALPLARMALAFTRLQSIDGGDRVAGAMRAHPELIRGARSPDTMLMRGLEGWIAKGGAEGVFCAASPDGLGIALKVEDGNWRAIGPAVAAFLLRIVGQGVPELISSPVRNSRGEVVGEVTAHCE
jgi:L-asparaginase II